MSNMVEQNISEQNMVCVLGVTGVQGAVELYAVNPCREVTMHGWFAQMTGFSVLSERLPCLVAVDSDALSDEMIAALRIKGHHVVVMPTVNRSAQSKYRRTAKDVCQFAIGLADIHSTQTARTLQ